MALVQHNTLCPPHDLSDLEQLSYRFAQLAEAAFEIPIPTGEDGRDVLQAVLCEINETMLPRRLTLVASPGASLTLLISNRRLLAIETQGLPDDLPQMMPKEVARHFASVLRGFIAEAEAVTLLRPAHLDGYASADISVSASLLSEALGLTPRHVAHEEGRAHISTLLRDAASAWIDATPELQFGAAHGVEAELRILRDFWISYMGKIAARPGDQRLQKLSTQCIWLPFGPEKCLVLSTEDEQHWVLALMTKTRFQGLAKDYHTRAVRQS